MANATKDLPPRQTVEYAAKALGIPGASTIKVLTVAARKLGLSKPSDFVGSNSKLLLTAAKAVQE